jgi:peptide/nickel transport system substrate-binding protein
MGYRGHLRRAVALGALIAMSVGVAACGSDSKDSTSTTAAPNTTTGGSAPSTTGGGTAAPSTTGGGTAAPAGELKIAASMADLATLDPPRAFADINGLLQPLFGEPLVTIDPAAPTKILPGLADSWTVSDDGLTYTFKLRDGVKFSTGNPMTADDVVFSFERLKNIQGSVAFVLDGAKSIVATDPKTVTITLSEPDSAFLAKATNSALMVLDSATLKQNGAVSDTTAKDADKAEAFLNTATVGTGPYMLKEWNRNERIVFDANPNYTGAAKPAYATITVQDVREPATQAQLLQGGTVDLATNIDSDTAAGLKGASGVNVDTVQSVNLLYLALNGKAPSPFADPKVREALQKAIDYEGIGTLTGTTKRPAAVIPLGLQGIDQVTPVATDVEGAKKLLADAGLGSGTSIDVTYANYAPYGVPLTTLWEKISADLAKVNIKLNLKPVEYDAWLQAYRAGGLPLTSSIWAPDFLDVTNYLDWFGSPDSPVSKRVGFNSPEVGALYQQVKATTDPAKRETLSAEAATMMRDDASLIPVVQPNSIIVYRSTIDNVMYSPNHQIELTAIKPA